jgi:hypothetical protein
MPEDIGVVVEMVINSGLICMDVKVKYHIEIQWNLY